MGYITREFINDVASNIIVTTFNLREFFTTEIHIVSLDAYDGEPVVPTTGTYTIYMQLVEKGSFLPIEDLDGIISGPQSGGSALADGQGAYVLTRAVPHAIKVVPASIDVATHYKVTIKQIGNT